MVFGFPIVGLILDGFYVVSIILLVALGLAIYFGLVGVFNIAHGEFLVMGSYMVVFLQQYVGFWWCLAVAPAITALMGLVLERGMIRHFYAKPILGFIGTWGVSLILQQSYGLVFTVLVFGFSYSAYQLFVIATGGLAFLAFVFVFLKTGLGARIRAAIHNPQMAAALGINVERIYVTAFVFGSALAGFGGAILGPMIPVFPYIGFYYVPQAFYTVMLGGLGQVLGIGISSLVVGQIANTLNYSLPAGIAQTALLVVVIVIMRVRPQGIWSRG
jgi:branched-subunit amino acid ABC-type transport system permease component